MSDFLEGKDVQGYDLSGDQAAALPKAGGCDKSLAVELVTKQPRHPYMIGGDIDPYKKDLEADTALLPPGRGICGGYDE